MFQQLDPIDRFTQTLETAAAEAGIQILDTEGGYYEIEFLGVVDRQTLLAFVAAMRAYGERELEHVTSDSGLVTLHS